MFRLFSHHWELCLGGGEWTQGRQGQCPLRTHLELTFAICRGPDYHSHHLPFHLVQNVTSSLKHLRPLIVVPVFTVLLVSCSRTWAGKNIPTCVSEEEELSSIIGANCADEAGGYFYKLALLTLQDELFFPPPF